MDNNSKEVGGTHYEQLKVQPIDLIQKCKLTFIQGNILKYISRYKVKNGAEDIKKCIHYAQLATRYGDTTGKVNPASQASMYCTANSLTKRQRMVIMSLFEEDYYHIVKQCLKLLKLEYPNEL